jgi:2-hydroxy-6-oxonona-2,4-dienedioate hydrolase
MTRQAALPASRSSRSERHGLAEAALWMQHGLRPVERFVELRSPAVTVRVLEVGIGWPTLFIHGTIGPGSWPSLIQAMPDVRSIVLDRPGWGSSGPIPYPAHAYRRSIADLQVRLLDGLGLEQVDVIGGSIGDIWALALAEHHPSRVRRIALLGAGPLVPEVPVPRFIRLIHSPIGAVFVLLPLSRDRLLAILRDNGHGRAIDAGRIPEVFVAWRLAAANDTQAMRHEREMVRAVLTRSGWDRSLTFERDDLNRIGHPTMMIYGTEDSTGSADLWREVIGGMPSGRIVIMDGAGHQPWFDDVASVAAELRRFLGGA